MSWFNLRAQLQSMTEFANANAAKVNELNVELTEAHNELTRLRQQIAQVETTTCCLQPPPLTN